MQHRGLLQALQPARLRLEAGTPIEMDVGHLHQVISIGRRIPAHQLEHQLPDGMQSDLVDLGRLGEQGQIEGALQQLAAEVLAGSRFQPHRQAGRQRIDVVEPVVEIEFPEDGGSTNSQLLAETGRKRHILFGTTKGMEDGVCIGQQTLAGGCQTDVVAMTGKQTDPELLFKLADPEAHSRLGQIEIFSSPAKVPGLAHLDKGPKQLGIH